MRGLAINQRDLYYCLFVPFPEEALYEDEGDQDRRVYEDGFFSGDYVSEFGPLQTLRASLSSEKGGVNEEVFGLQLDYDLAVLTFDVDCPIQEDTILWIGKEMAVMKPHVGTAFTDLPKNLPPYNYRVVRRAESLNSVLFAVRRVDTASKVR